MSNQVFSNAIAQIQSLQAPVVKANKLAVANLEKLVAFQINALRSYTDLGVARLKAAAEVNDPKSLQDFISSQLEVAKVVGQKIADDSKALAELNAGFTAEFSKLAQDSAAEVREKVAEIVPSKAA